MHFVNATLVLPDRLVPNASLLVENGVIAAIGPTTQADAPTVGLGGMFLAPGFVDLHVHGGDGADFMDGTAEAFHTVCRAHARHGTTALLATTTVARHEQHLAFLETCRQLRGQSTGGAIVLGAHFYGPYFGLEARGCHPAAQVRSPVAEE